MRLLRPDQGKSGGDCGKDPEPLHRQKSSQVGGGGSLWPVQRRRIGAALAAALAAAVVVTAVATGWTRGSGGSGGSVSQAAAPVWAAVAPIFAEKCSGCHTVGGIAPFSRKPEICRRSSDNAALRSSMTAASASSPARPQSVAR